MSADDPLSLGTATARNLATTTKTVPQTRGITPRWLLRILPWVGVTGGTYRVNRRGGPPGRPDDEPLRPLDKHGQPEIAIAAGHAGEPDLPGAFADYATDPREYQLGVAQTVLRVHTRVADLYSDPMDQAAQQLRLTIEALRERQEHELVNNPGFGLLHNAHPKQRIRPRGGPPTPDDLDELLCRRRRSRCFLAHPDAIAAFGRECNRRGVYPQTVEVDGNPLQAWRGVPLLPCDKIPITPERTTSIVVMRLGSEHQGVVGLRPSSLPEEVEPGVNVRFMGISAKGIVSYLVSAYYSAAVLIPDALGVLEEVQL